MQVIPLRYQTQCLHFHLFRVDGYLKAIPIKPPKNRKPAICKGENKGADHMCSNCTVDQCLCFHPIDTTMSLLSNMKFQASSLLLWMYSLVCVGPSQIPSFEGSIIVEECLFGSDHRGPAFVTHIKRKQVYIVKIVNIFTVYTCFRLICVTNQPKSAPVFLQCIPVFT